MLVLQRKMNPAQRIGLPSPTKRRLNRNAAGQGGTGSSGRRSRPDHSRRGEVDIAAINGMLLGSPAPGQPAGAVSRPDRAVPEEGSRRSLLRQAQRGRGLLLRPRLGGGLDPGGARAPSRQRRPSPLPTGRTPVRRDARALFPAPGRRSRPRRGRPAHSRRRHPPSGPRRPPPPPPP